jgi:hypothetical protein
MAQRSNLTLSQEPSANGSPGGYGTVSVLVLLVLLTLAVSCGPTDQPPTTPNSSSLDQLVHKQVGEFELRNKRKLPKNADAGADKGLVMTYLAPDGTELTHYLFDFPSPQKANVALQVQVQNSKTEGFEQIDSGNIVDPEGSKIGSWVRMKQKDTIVMHWTNYMKYAVIAGPKSYVDELYAGVSKFY